MFELPGIVNLVADLLEVSCLTILFHKVKEEIYLLFHIVLHDGKGFLSAIVVFHTIHQI